MNTRLTNQVESSNTMLPPLPAVEPTPEAPLLGQTLKTERFRLRLVQVLNSGASGIVYKAIEETTRQEYAVKHMPNDSQLNRLASYNKDVLRSKLRDMPVTPQTPTLQHRFEASLHARCSNHPRVLSLHDAAYNAFGAYLVLDYCPEGDLFSLICDVGLRGGEREAKRLFLEACQAVSHCHRMNVYHRDIKPENLLVQRGRDDRLHVYLGDFGLATEHAWSKERGCGSPFYMSPECLLSKNGACYDSESEDNDSSNLNAYYGFASNSNSDDDDGHEDDGFVLPARHAYSTSASDVWSLGILLCNLASRRNPWRRADMSDQAYAYYLREPQTALARILPVTDDVHRILRRALDPNPDKRCTLNELYESVRNCLNFWCDAVCEDVASVINAHEAAHSEEQDIDSHRTTKVNIAIDTNKAHSNNDDDDDDMPPSPMPSLDDSILDDSTEADSDGDDEIRSTADTSSSSMTCISEPGNYHLPRVVSPSLHAVDELAKLQKKDLQLRAISRTHSPEISLNDVAPSSQHPAAAANTGSAFDGILPKGFSDTFSRLLRAALA
ncbi:kinase-like domain-containing protein [Syncephalis fuscata]|nr:kinase-like domain-containing protein [Syncephalis fuscata]